MLTKTLCNYIDAAFSGLWIETFEPEEAIREIDTLCRSENWRYGVWDCEQGLLQDGNDSKIDPLTVIQTLAAVPNREMPTLMVLRNFHRFLNSIEIIQAVERQISLGKTRRVFIIVLSPVVQIPPELEKLFVVLEHPLPDKEQLRQIATEIFSESELPEEATLQKVLNAAAGIPARIPLLRGGDISSSPV